MKTTEQESLYQDLENQSVSTLLQQINQEDKKVADAVNAALPQIEALVNPILLRMQKGGRLFYMGAGTSGRLGILDASECPPTYGVSHNLVVGIIAGGDRAIRKAVEFAEDSTVLGWKDLQEKNITEMDSVIGIAASGTTPYVITALKACQTANILTGCITCNANSPITKYADFPIEVIVGPEYVTGSTRMKAGTAQKLIINSITTATMINLGHIKGSKMIDMKLSNEKLKGRAELIVIEATGVDLVLAQKLIKENGGVRGAIDAFNKK